MAQMNMIGTEVSNGGITMEKQYKMHVITGTHWDRE